LINSGIEKKGEKKRKQTNSGPDPPIAHAQNNSPKSQTLVAAA
jgi:hypothetical protein